MFKSQNLVWARKSISIPLLATPRRSPYLHPPARTSGRGWLIDRNHWIGEEFTAFVQDTGILTVLTQGPRAKDHLTSLGG